LLFVQPLPASRAVSQQKMISTSTVGPFCDFVILNNLLKYLRTEKNLKKQSKREETEKEEKEKKRRGTKLATREKM